jgi:signal transduction histidine kinase
VAVIDRRKLKFQPFFFVCIFACSGPARKLLPTNGCRGHRGISIDSPNRFLHETPLAEGLTGADSGRHEAGSFDYNFPTVITDMPINAMQRRMALIVVVVLSVIGIATAPLADLPEARIDVFLPVLQAVLCVVDLISATLLYSQYWIRPRYAGLAIASGYQFSGLFAFAQTLAFPGAYSAAGLIGYRDTAGWIFILWHTVFSTAVLIYALTKERNERQSKLHRSPTVVIESTIATVIIVTATATFMVSSFPGLLPTLYLNDTQQTAWANAADIYLSLLNIATLTVLFFRRRTILDLWLLVTLFAWLPNFLTSACFTFVRFSIGWYVSRCFSVFASSTLLVVLLSEMTMLYVRLASSTLLLRRERTGRLASVEAATAAIAHEIRQPLAGIASFSFAGTKWLSRRPANVDRARSCFASILSATERSEEIITSVRRLFKKTPSAWTMIQLNDLIRLVMRLTQHDLLSGGIAVTTEYQGSLPLTYGDPTQLQQVVLNLVKNAIDAMHDRPAGERRLRLATGSDEHSAVSFYIRDSGSGVAVEDRERIFNPFFTTKMSGMGLGLTICRTIIEEHGGTLRLTKSGPGGSTFEFALPITSSQPTADAEHTASARA